MNESVTIFTMLRPMYAIKCCSVSLIAAFYVTLRAIGLFTVGM